MKYHTDAETKIRRTIRDTIALDPLVTTVRLQKILADKGMKGAGGTELAWEYVAKQVKRVNREVITNAERQVAVARVAEIKERHRLAMGKLLRIAFFDPQSPDNQGMPLPSYKDQISAIREMMRWDLAILSAEMDAGIFQRQLGTAEIEVRNKPLPPELMEGILTAMNRWGILQKPKVVEAEVVTEQPNHGTDTPQLIAPAN